MRAHYAIDIIAFLPKFVQKPCCKPTLAVVTMYNKLGDPTHCLAVGDPAAGKHVSSKLVVDGDSDILTRGRIREVFLSEFFCGKSDSTTCCFLSRY